MPVRDTRRIAFAGAGMVLAAILVAVGLSIDTRAARDSSPEGRPGEPHACTEVGCDSGVIAIVSKVRRHLPEAHRITLCATGKCRSFGRRSDLAAVRLPRVDGERRVWVRLVVRGADGNLIHRDRNRVRLRRQRPNGPGCPPVCYSCSLGLDGDLNLRRRG